MESEMDHSEGSLISLLDHPQSVSAGRPSHRPALATGAARHELVDTAERIACGVACHLDTLSAERARVELEEGARPPLGVGEGESMQPEIGMRPPPVPSQDQDRVWHHTSSSSRAQSHHATSGAELALQLTRGQAGGEGVHCSSPEASDSSLGSGQSAHPGSSSRPSPSPGARMHSPASSEGSGDGMSNTDQGTLQGASSDEVHCAGASSWVGQTFILGPNCVPHSLVI